MRAPPETSQICYTGKIRGRSMKKKVTALILCGGKGDRLRPLTDSLPKPLVLLGGRPILS